MSRFCVLLLALCLITLSPRARAQGPAAPDAPSYARSAAAPSRAADTPSALPNSVPVANGMAPAVPAIAVPMAAPPRPKVLDKKYWFLTSLAVGLTVADVELTQRCLHHGTCRELNPLLPHSHAGMYLANVPVTGALFYWSYRRKARGQRLWWLPTLIDAGAHGGGAADNTRFR